MASLGGNLGLLKLGGGATVSLPPQNHFPGSCTQFCHC